MRLTVLTGALPLFGVCDLARSTRFYTYGLGFTLVRGAATPANGMPAFAQLRRGGVDLVVYERDPLAGPLPGSLVHRSGLLYVAVSDVEALSAELRIRWLRVSTGAGERYCDVEDPDGNVLRFGAETEPVLEALVTANS